MCYLSNYFWNKEELRVPVTFFLKVSILFGKIKKKADTPEILKILFLVKFCRIKTDDNIVLLILILNKGRDWRAFASIVA